MNEKWRDYSKYTDKQLDDLLKGFAGQGDYAAVAFEYQRRQNARQEADNKSRHEETQRLARWAMIFAALSVVLGTVFGLIPHCSNKPPSSATHPEASTGPSHNSVKYPKAHEPRQTPAISPEQPPTKPITTSIPEEDARGVTRAASRHRSDSGAPTGDLPLQEGPESWPCRNELRRLKTTRAYC